MRPTTEANSTLGQIKPLCFKDALKECKRNLSIARSYLFGHCSLCNLIFCTLLNSLHFRHSSIPTYTDMSTSMLPRGLCTGHTVYGTIFQGVPWLTFSLALRWCSHVTFMTPTLIMPCKIEPFPISLTLLYFSFALCTSYAFLICYVYC